MSDDRISEQAGPVRSGHAPSAPPPREEEISLLELFNVLLKHRYGIVGLAVLFGLLSMGFALVRTSQFTATASFVPQGSDASAGRIASLAGQFGVSVPSSAEGAEESPAFYAELLRSREILRPVADARYTVGSGSPRSAESSAGTLAELLEIEEDTPALELAEALDWLRDDAVDVETDLETGLVVLSVASPWPELSFEIASRLVTLVNEFNLETRQTRAAAERAFIEDRLAEANDSLLAAETRLEGFLQANRQFANSPELGFQHDRLQRQVMRAQEVVNSLSQSYEEARVSEVRNTPVITIVDSPELPLRPEPRNAIFMTLLGVMLGGILGVFLALGLELIGNERARGSDTYDEFSRLLRKTWWDVRTFRGRLS